MNSWMSDALHDAAVVTFTKSIARAAIIAQASKTVDDDSGACSPSAWSNDRYRQRNGTWTG